MLNQRLKSTQNKCEDLYGCMHCMFSQLSRNKTIKMKGGGKGDSLKGEIKEKLAISLCLVIKSELN